MVNLSNVERELDRKENGGRGPRLYWRKLGLGDEEPVPMCRACIERDVPAARFEDDEGADPSLPMHRRVLPCETGGAVFCYNVVFGQCASDE
ncbi:MAG: hypothetical protein JW809_19520 [Pirellulales bacterium]|nr:hypothetical protein [Pirellulales bacterium]